MFHTIKLSKSDPTPLYIQLASELAKLIQGNLLTEGMKLPTIRFLSNQLSINRDTVVSAYKLLENQGLVESHIGKGTYISSPPTSTTVTLPIDSTSQICCSHIGVPRNFFPSSLCLDLATEIIKKDSWEAFNDPLYRERNLLKHTVSDFLKQLCIPHHYAQVRIIKTMDQFLLDLFRDSPKTGICVEAIRDLTCSCYLRSLGAKIYEVPLTSEGIDLNILEKHLHTGNIAYIFISSILQNPTGLCYSVDCKKKLVALAQKYNCTIIDDITYASFMYKTPTTIYDDSAPIIYIHQFSKIYLPYINYTFAILPTAFNKRLRDPIECSFNERLLRHYLSSPELKTIEQTIFSTFEKRYSLLYDAFRQLPLRIASLNGGVFFWLRVPVKQYELLCQHLLEHEIIISPGDLFATTNLKGYLRLSITHLDSVKIYQVIQAFKDFFTTTYL